MAWIYTNDVSDILQCCLRNDIELSRVYPFGKPVMCLKFKQNLDIKPNIITHSTEFFSSLPKHNFSYLGLVHCSSHSLQCSPSLKPYFQSFLCREPRFHSYFVSLCITRREFYPRNWLCGLNICTVVVIILSTLRDGSSTRTVFKPPLPHPLHHVPFQRCL